MDSRNFEQRHPEHLRDRPVAWLGHIAIGPEALGINDPKTHLHDYLLYAEKAVPAIREDIVTEVAERLASSERDSSYFVNSVDFEFTGHDFVSVKDGVYMKLMTEANAHIVRKEAKKTTILSEDLARAELELNEPYQLEDWFKEAAVGAYFIIESPPIGRQNFAISRIFQKTGEASLAGYFVSLHNPSIRAFNELHTELDVEVPLAQTPLEIQANAYNFYSPDHIDPGDFIKYYVDKYDGVLQRHSPYGEEFVFGIAKTSDTEAVNIVEKVRSHEKLADIYADTVRVLACSEGIATPELMTIRDKLKLNIAIQPNSRLELSTAEEFLEKVIFGITSAVDRADPNLLKNLNLADTYSETGYAAVALYGSQAAAAGETYDNLSCTKISGSGTDANPNSEAGILARAYRARLNGKLFEDFGTPKMSVCRTRNCVSRGDSMWWPMRTIVGGCDLCVDCHTYIKKGERPEFRHAERRRKLAEERVQKEKLEKQLQRTA